MKRAWVALAWWSAAPLPRLNQLRRLRVRDDIHQPFHSCGWVFNRCRTFDPLCRDAAAVITPGSRVPGVIECRVPAARHGAKLLGAPARGPVQNSPSRT